MRTTTRCSLAAFAALALAAPVAWCQTTGPIKRSDFDGFPDIGRDARAHMNFLLQWSERKFLALRKIWERKEVTSKTKDAREWAGSFQDAENIFSDFFAKAFQEARLHLEARGRGNWPGDFRKWQQWRDAMMTYFGEAQSRGGRLIQIKCNMAWAARTLRRSAEGDGARVRLFERFISQVDSALVSWEVDSRKIIRGELPADQTLRHHQRLIGPLCTQARNWVTVAKEIRNRTKGFLRRDDWKPEHLKRQLDKGFRDWADALSKITIVGQQFDEEIEVWQNLCKPHVKAYQEAYAAYKKASQGLRDATLYYDRPRFRGRRLEDLFAPLESERASIERSLRR